MPSPPRRLQPVAFAESWASLRAAPPCLGLPARSVPVGLSQLAVEEAGSSGDVGPGEAAHAHVPQKPLPLRHALPVRGLPGCSPSCFWSFSAAALRSALAAAASSCLLHTLPLFAAQRAPPRGHAGRSRAQPSWDPASLCSCCEPALLRALSTQALPGLLPEKDAPTPPATVPQAKFSCPLDVQPASCSLITSVSSLSLGDGNARRSRNGVQAQS